MCVKLSSGELNPNPCPPHPTSTYTCRMTIALNMYGGSTLKGDGMYMYILTL